MLIINIIEEFESNGQQLFHIFVSNFNGKHIGYVDDPIKDKRFIDQEYPNQDQESFCELTNKNLYHTVPPEEIDNKYIPNENIKELMKCKLILLNI